MRTFITIKNIDKRFGSKIIFQNASLALMEGQKVGVIGRNGAGKSTFCRLITGDESVDEGEIIKSADLRLGFLEQHDSFLEEETALDFLIRFTGKKDWECGRMAGRFQIKNDLLTKMKIHQLSGGYKTRIKLSAMLLMDPNFLILDEPTNFLDMKTQILLENFLKSYKGGFAIVSHDREFLKRTCTTTLDIAYNDFEHYQGDIDAWLEEKALRVEQITRTNKNVLLKQKQLQTFIDKNKAKAFGSAQARNKQKQLDRLELTTLQAEEKTVKIKIPHIDHRDGRALQCFDLNVGYADKLVASEINLTIDRGSHVAILGENGQGKTTFLRTIAQDLRPLQGTLKWGHQIEIAYYAQHVYRSIPETETVFSYLEKSAAGNQTRQEILNMAGSFLFHGDDVLKPVKVLSGGERARLCLAGLLLKRTDVLLLDEPTNHLDFETVQALARTMSGFNGTIFFVCHDRDFIKAIAKQIIEIKDQRLRIFPGKYEDYLFYLEKEAAEAENEERHEPRPPTQKENQDHKITETKESFEKRKKLKNKLQKQQKEFETYQKQKANLEAQMVADPEQCSLENSMQLDQYVQQIKILEEDILNLMIELDEGSDVNNMA